MLYRQSKVDVSLFNDIFMDLDALRATRLYAENALDYAVYQAFYNLSASGFGSREWNTVPNSDDVFLMLKQRIADNMALYSNTAFRFMKKTIKLPVYEMDNIEIEDDGNHLNISAKGDRKFIVESVYNNGAEYVVLKDSSRIFRVYDFSIVSFLKLAKDVFNRIKAMDCKALNAGDVVIDEAKVGYHILSAVYEKTDAPCTAKINVSLTYRKSIIMVYNNGQDMVINPFLNFTIVI